MIPKDQFMMSVGQEYHILRHLHSKILPGTFDYKPTEGQRTLRQLLGFLVHGPLVGARVLQNGDQSLFMKMDEEIKNYDEKNFLADLEAAEKEVMDIIKSLSDERLAEDLEVFGAKMKCSFWTINLILAALIAYRMQFFLYLKSSGRIELNTANLWMGRDSKPGEVF